MITVPFVSPITKIGGGAWYPVAGVLGVSTEMLEYCSFFLLFTFLSFYSFLCLAWPVFLFSYLFLAFLFFFFFPIRIPLIFLKENPMFFFSKQGLSYRVFLNNNFSNFKLESDFFPPLLSKIRKLENYANIFILNYKWPNFQRNWRE